MCVVQTSSHQKILSKTSCHKNTRCPNILSDRKKTLPETSCHSNICCPTVVFLEAFGRLYCQHLPPILAQGPPHNGAKPALTRADPPILGLSWAPWAPLLPASSPCLPPGAQDKRQATPELKKEPFATSQGLYCQHLLPILAQGPPLNGAKPALTRVLSRLGRCVRSGLA